MIHRLYPGLNLGPAHGDDHAEAEPVIFGFWVFLMSDLITFGILFATYATSATTMGRAGGPGPAELFNLASVALQTGALLASSLTCGLAALAVKHRLGSGTAVGWLIATMLLGTMFLGLELSDFHQMIGAGATPDRSAWLSSYFALVGLHGLHISAGLIWAAVMIGLLHRQPEEGRTKQRLLMFGLYWHFLDLIWIGILSVVFLAGLA